MSIHQWIASRVPGGHNSNLGQLLDVAYTVEYGADTRDQSALNLIYMLSGSERKPMEVFGESDERYHLRGGNQRLPVAMAAALPRGTVRTGRRLTRIVSDADGSVTLTFESASAKETVVADRVILTLPFAVLRTLDFGDAGFDSRKRAAINELGAGRTAKLMVQFGERGWSAQTEGPGNGATFTDLPYQASWDVTRAQPGKSGVIVGFSGGPGVRPYHTHSAPYTTARNTATHAAATTFVEQFNQVFPGVQEQFNGKAHLATPYQDPNFRCSYSYYRVGQYHRFGGYEKIRQRSIHFAGEHCSQDYQGFMEGGASEGLRAANEVLAAVQNPIRRAR
jgi:monoamine oxidase